MGTWGLGVAVGDNPLGFGGWGQPFRFRGLGHGDLAFRGGSWGQPCFGGWDIGGWDMGRTWVGFGG